MGLSENPTNHPEKQETRRRGAPRIRLCLLKGCGRRFRPRQAGQRYCGGPCRKAARTWSRWKAQGRYRATPAGKQQRNGQSRRYRECVRNRKTPADEALSDAARVITPVFLKPVATGPAATRGSLAGRARRGKGSARTNAGARWSASGSVSGAGRAVGRGRAAAGPGAAR